MSYRKIFFVGLQVFILLIPAFTLWSHPHVFLYSTVKVVFDEKGLAGVQVNWVFDEMFSSMMILDFDKNGNRRFEPSEIESVKKGAFENLRKFDYFMHIKIDGKPFKVKYVKDFSAEISKGKMAYRFFVPCHVRAEKSLKEIKLSIYDSTFYSSVSWQKNPVTFENRHAYEAEHTIKKNRDEAYYYGQVYPEEIILKFRQKNG
ncbi:MAG: DUF1007 family protein [Pseudomonadota bacterium]|nr:DUF1007 family protein [Pseudomonadota bacterium]